ncbi:hypothetical protein EVG20_g2819 [Dentipellis fragilis]|uniref:Uncharacterized protein n=1 Tax=Dentipellis fragilis TaxID=205917 RepID=A0A4Y9Z5Q2_9AGAM|nr:hypothetical protein EVG20_g2819 [Dentipellis fragilis]
MVNSTPQIAAGSWSTCKISVIGIQDQDRARPVGWPSGGGAVHASVSRPMALSKLAVALYTAEELDVLESRAIGI